MGCDIHAYAERRSEDGERFYSIQHEDYKPFSDREYPTFAFLAGVRNYNNIQPICRPRGLPKDIDAYILDMYKIWGGDCHNMSWVLTKELVAYDYSRVYDIDGKGKQKLIELLGLPFRAEIHKLVSKKVDRVTFWFDN